MSYGPECFTLFPRRRSKMPATTPQPTPALAALERAERADPGNQFVASCRRFHEQHGDLSAKQIAALGRVTRTRVAAHRGQRASAVLARGTSLHISDDPVEQVREEYDAGQASWEDVEDAAFDQEWGGNFNSWDWAGGD